MLYKELLLPYSYRLCLFPKLLRSGPNFPTSFSKFHTFIFKHLVFCHILHCIVGFLQPIKWFFKMCVHCPRRASTFHPGFASVINFGKFLTIIMSNIFFCSFPLLLAYQLHMLCLLKLSHNSWMSCFYFLSFIKFAFQFRKCLLACPQSHWFFLCVQCIHKP